MPNVRETTDPGNIPPGQRGPTVYVVVEEWIILDDGSKGLTVEAVHLTQEGAEANLEPTDTSGIRKRFIVTVEAQS